MDTLDVLFCVNDGYVDYMQVALYSLLENYNPDHRVNIHVFSDYISSKSMGRLMQIVDGCPFATLQTHVVEDSCLAGLKTGTYTKYTWYRILAPEILANVDKVLYLDCDVCVDDDVSELASIAVGDWSLAAPMDTDTFLDEPFERCGYPKYKQYVCCGVLMLNLDYWRKNDLSGKIINWARQNEDKLKYPDQDSINYVCQDSKLQLPLRFGVTKSLFTEPHFYKAEYVDQLRECLSKPAIIHYAGCAPWFMESNHTLTSRWRLYNKRLRHPARVEYKTTGWIGLKLRLWDVINFGKQRSAITHEEIMSRIAKVHR